MFASLNLKRNAMTMRTKLLLLFTLFTIATTVTTFAQTVVEAKDLAEAGQFEKARALYNEILQKVFPVPR